MWGNVAIAILLSFIVTFAITPMVIKLAKKINAVDIPKDERRIHTKPMPRIGGISFVIGFFIAIIYVLISSLIDKNMQTLLRWN